VAAGVSAGRRAADRLIAGREELATSLTAALYADLPHLQDKYGDRGRMRCHEDMRFNIEHLAPAVAMESPEMFAGYVRWLDELLRARAVDTSEVVRSLELLIALVHERLPPVEAEACEAAIRAGLRALEAAP
jgi:MerR family transcriptional regulator, light-induced transcriptional regulator